MRTPGDTFLRFKKGVIICNYSENRGIRIRCAAQQRQDESRYAAYLQDTGARAIFSENFSSIRSVFSFPLDGQQEEQQQQEQDEVNMPPI